MDVEPNNDSDDGVGCYICMNSAQNEVVVNQCSQCKESGTHPSCLSLWMHSKAGKTQEGSGFRCPRCKGATIVTFQFMRLERLSNLGKKLIQEYEQVLPDDWLGLQRKIDNGATCTDLDLKRFNEVFVKMLQCTYRLYQCLTDLDIHILVALNNSVTERQKMMHYLIGGAKIISLVAYDTGVEQFMKDGHHIWEHVLTNDMILENVKKFLGHYEAHYYEVMRLSKKVFSFTSPTLTPASSSSTEAPNPNSEATVFPISIFPIPREILEQLRQ